MVVRESRAKDIKIAYIGGGSRNWAWTLMADLASEESLSGKVSLYDIDRSAAEKNAVIGNRTESRKEARGKWKYEVASSLEESVKDADFVVISILPGTFDEMEVDVHEPERYGIYQSVGDTAGLGGIIRALRTLPMIRDIALAVREYAPSAWVINYTNPMSLCVKTLYHVFPEIKAFGCCHEVFHTEKLLAEIMEEITGEKSIDRREIMVNVVGINHFTWFDKASYEGTDLFPIYRDFADRHFESGFAEMGGAYNRYPFSCTNRVKFDLFRRYGLIAAAGDRHLAEFMDGTIYLKDPERAESWGFVLTPVSWRREDLKERLERSDRLYRGEENLIIEKTDEEGVDIIKALCGLSRMVTNMNLPNKWRQILNLPEDAVVETNAVITRDSIQPVACGGIDEGVLSLVKPFVENHDRIMKAALTCDRDLVYEAFEKDSQVAKRLSKEDARNLADTMIEKTGKYLPEGWFK